MFGFFLSNGFTQGSSHPLSKSTLALAVVAQLVGCHPLDQKVTRVGHMPGLQVWSQVGVRGRDDQSMFLSLSFSLPSPLSRIDERGKKSTADCWSQREGPGWKCREESEGAPTSVVRVDGDLDKVSNYRDREK